MSLSQRAAKASFKLHDQPLKLIVCFRVVIPSVITKERRIHCLKGMIEAANSRVRDRRYRDILGDVLKQQGSRSQLSQQQLHSQWRFSFMHSSGQLGMGCMLIGAQASLPSQGSLPANIPESRRFARSRLCC